MCVAPSRRWPRLLPDVADRSPPTGERASDAPASAVGGERALSSSVLSSSVPSSGASPAIPAASIAWAAAPPPLPRSSTDGSDEPTAAQQQNAPPATRPPPTPRTPAALRAMYEPPCGGGTRVFSSDRPAEFEWGKEEGRHSPFLSEPNKRAGAHRPPATKPASDEWDAEPDCSEDAYYIWMELFGDEDEDGAVSCSVMPKNGIGMLLCAS